MYNIRKLSVNTVYFDFGECVFVCVLAGVQILLQHFQTEEANVLGQGHKGSSSETKLLLTIWALANQESFRQLSDRFDLSRPQSHYVFRQGCTILSRLASSSVIWPSKKGTEMLAASNSFPGAFAAVDGCHIPIRTPLKYSDSYVNRKGFASIILQAVCTPNLRFVDLSTGCPGSLHDARVYRRSRLCAVLNSGDLNQDVHVLGDSAYPLQMNLLVPYRDNGHLTEKQRRYNYMHSLSRCAIERAFGLLKGKFRRLRYLDVCTLSAVPNVVVAACVLHNFILQMESEDMSLQTGEDEDSELREAGLHVLDQYCDVEPAAGAAAKRDGIADKL